MTRILPYCLTAILLIGTSLVQFFPTLLFPIAISLAVLLGLCTYFIIGAKLWSPTFWALFITPFWLLVSSIALLMILESTLIRWVIALIVPSLEGFYLRQLFLYFRFPEKYQAHALENLSSALNVIVAFFAFSSLYGLRLFLGLGWALLLPVCIGIVATTAYQSFWVQKISNREGLLWLIGIGLLLPEMFIVIGFLPTNNIVNGQVMAICVYLVFTISRLAIRHNSDKRLVIRHASLAFCLLLITLLTAQWV